MGIEVILADVQYKKTKPIKGELPIITVMEVRREDYPEYVKLGTWSNDEKLYVHPYVGAGLKKPADKKREIIYKRDIAIKMDIETAGEVERIVAKSSEHTEHEYFYQKHASEAENCVFFIPPKEWEQNPYTRELQEKIVGHYVSLGNEIIRIHWKNYQSESMHLISKYSDAEKDFYKDIITDLIAIHQQLCMEDKSAISMATKWSEDLISETEKVVNEFCEAFWKLEKNVVPELKKFQEKMPFHKVKKINSRTLIEREVFHKDKVTANVYREDLDTYEHRVIKNYVSKLQKLIEMRQTMEEIALKNEKAHLEDNLKLSDETIHNRIKEFSDSIEDEKKRRQEKLLVDTPTTKNGERVCVEFWANSDTCFKIRENDIVLDVNVYKFDHRNDNCLYGVQKYSGWEEHKYQYGNAKPTQFVQIRFPMGCKKSAAILFRTLYQREALLKKANREGAEIEKIQIYGYVKSGYASMKKEYSNFTFSFDSIDTVKFKIRNGTAFTYRISDISEVEYLQSWEDYKKYILDLEAKGSNSETLAFYKLLQDNKEKVKKLDKKIQDVAKWELLKEKLNKIEKDTFLNKVSNMPVTHVSSNLFSFHPLYHTIYDVMQTHQQVLEYIDYYNEDTNDALPVGKLADIYEHWCCIKILLTFIQLYGFSFVSISNKDCKDDVEVLKDYITDILNGKDTLSGTKFELQHIEDKWNMNLVMWYEREFRLNKPALKRDSVYVGNQTRMRKPDFVIRIRYNDSYSNYNQKEHWFVMDAKEKTAENYDGVKDLCEVAFQKYMLELGYGRLNSDENRISYNLKEKDQISGSFILHSNINAKANVKEEECINYAARIKYPKVKVVYDPKKYLGDYIDEWCREWKKASLNVNWEKFEEWSLWNGRSNNDNRLGIVVMNPKENNLTYIIQMIMEKYFNLYGSRCWICGGETKSELKHTEAGFEKYYYWCQNDDACGELTVKTHCYNGHSRNMKLGKHKRNYYAQSLQGGEKSCWNVSCPICREILPDSTWKTQEVCAVKALGVEECPF